MMIGFEEHIELEIDLKQLDENFRAKFYRCDFIETKIVIKQKQKNRKIKQLLK